MGITWSGNVTSWWHHHANLVMLFLAPSALFFGLYRDDSGPQSSRKDGESGPVGRNGKKNLIQNGPLQLTERHLVCGWNRYGDWWRLEVFVQYHLVPNKYHTYTDGTPFSLASSTSANYHAYVYWPAWCPKRLQYLFLSGWFHTAEFLEGLESNIFV